MYTGYKNAVAASRSTRSRKQHNNAVYRYTYIIHAAITDGDDDNNNNNSLETREIAILGGGGRNRRAEKKS